MGVEMIMKVFEMQYLKKLEQDYNGYTDVNIFCMLEHLFTWYTVTNRHKVAIKK